MMCHYPHLLIDGRRSDDLEHALKICGIRARTWDHVTPPTVNLDLRAVTTGWPFVRSVWARFAGYLAVFEWWEREGEPGSIANFVADPRNAPVLKLFSWGQEQAASDKPIGFPADVPRPPPPGCYPVGFAAIKELLSQKLTTQFEGRVTRMCQRALGWITLHEIGHLMIGHAPVTEDSLARPLSVGSQMQEQEADHYASIWLLDWPKAEPDRLSVLGVIGAHVILASDFLDPSSREALPETHVPPLTRLRRLLLTFLPEHKLGWRAASLFLELELWAQSLPSADSEAFGTDDHLCRIHVLSGGKVV